MMDKKEKLVIAFSTTTAAMAMEDACRRAGAGGRMIPVPALISAGCGLAWCADPDEEADLRLIAEENGISCQGFYLCLI